MFVALLLSREAVPRWPTDRVARFAHKHAGGGNIDAAVALAMVSQVGRSSAQAAPKLDVGDYHAIVNAMAA
jgi:hypothetical protein